MSTDDFALRSRRIVLAGREVDGAVLVRAGAIVDVVEPDAVPVTWRRIDVGDLAVLPGVVDSHVHVNEPGRTEWEGFATASAAAAAGGVTTIVDMPLNSLPVTTTVAALEAKLAAAEQSCTIDYGLWAGLVPENCSDEQTLRDLVGAGALGFKCFMCDSGIAEFGAVDEACLRAALPTIAQLGVPLLVHAELVEDAPAWNGDAGSYSAWLATRPSRFELRAIELLARLAREYGCHIHVVHLASADSEAAAIAHAATQPLQGPTGGAAPAAGHLTFEACPHYLTFCAEEIPDADPRFKCAPPIRSRDHREGLWQLIADGTIGLVASDHSPAPPEIKQLDSGDIQHAWGGIASVQLSLAATWTGLSTRGGTLSDLARLMCTAPADLARLSNKGRLEPLADADFVVFDPDATWTVDEDALLNRHHATPYAGRELRGRVESTYLRGVKIYDRHDNVAAGHRGRWQRASAASDATQGAL